MTIAAACGNDNGETDQSAGVTGPDGEPADCGIISDLFEPGLEGETIPLGAFLSLTGQGTQYGELMGNGMRLAASHIEEAGGPTFDFVIEDNASGDPVAGAEAARAVGEAGVGAVLSSQSFNVGSALPAIADNEMFTIDPGGGTFFFWGEPFAWGSKAIVFYDSIAGSMQYVAETTDAETVAYVGVDLGGDFTEQQFNQMQEYAEENGLEVVGEPVTHELGATDFSTAISRVEQYNPDVIAMFNYGDDTPFFTSQYRDAGGEALLVAPDYTDAAAEIAGDAYDENILFAFDYLDVDNPANDWTACFVQAYEEEYGEDPDTYAAGFYESLFAMWEVMKRVEAEGGDITSGPDLQAAFESDPTFPSVFGGDGDTPGELGFDPETHSVATREISLLQGQADGEPEARASFDIDGSDFGLREG